jgi:hypothetical protein
MTDWIDFAVYATFMFALYFVQPTAQQRLIVPFLADRNGEWVEAHPDEAHRIASTRWRLWLSYGLGTIVLGLLATFQIGLWGPQPGPGTPKWAVLWELAMAGLVVAMVIGGAIGLWSHFALKRHIPVAPRRQARLERRSLDTAVPRWLQLCTYALVIANLAAWTVAGILGTHSSPVFWTRVIILFGLSIFFHLATRATVARRTNVMDRIFGPGHRTWEMRIIFSTQILPPVIGALRLYEEVTATQLLDLSRAMQIALAVFISWWLLSLSRLPIDPGASSRGGTDGAAMPAVGS